MLIGDSFRASIVAGEPLGFCPGRQPPLRVTSRIPTVLLRQFLPYWVAKLRIGLDWRSCGVSNFDHAGSVDAGRSLRPRIGVHTNGGGGGCVYSRRSYEEEGLMSDADANTGFTLPSTKMELDEQGRVVITDPALADHVRQVLESNPSDASVGHLRAMDNTGCVNAIAYCG